ncbi:hypothetical protein NECID01_0169 [Nematocida sp. AWRm77]|nr:hypothetical protein NECID01_0169 [Nematocida sp. AWRm77]
MREKGQKPSALSPLVSNTIWARTDGIKDWKIVGNSSLGRARARSIVGDMCTVNTKAEALQWAEHAEAQEGRKRSMSTSAVSELALRLGLEENEEQYKGLCAALKEEVSRHEVIKMERGTLTSLRRHSLDSSLFYKALQEEKFYLPNKSFAPRPRSFQGESLCIVQFGSGAKCFGTYTGPGLIKGVFVIIEADRGEDCGSVFQESIDPKAIQDVSAKHGISIVETKTIHRIATQQDKIRLLEQNVLEGEAVESCKERVKARKLCMEIISAEYQWDRKKLTFYFKSEKRVDFRDLVKELYRVYKTRIWMCAIEKRQDKEVLARDRTTEEGAENAAPEKEKTDS